MTTPSSTSGTEEPGIPTSTMYRIIRVPRVSSRLAEIVMKSRTTRLHALKTDPTAFLAQHDVEDALPLEVWHKRLTNPDITVLVCVATCAGNKSKTDDIESTHGMGPVDSTDSLEEADVALLLATEWIAVAALRAMSYGQYYASPDMGLPVPEHPEAEARWHVFDLYTLPSHRGRGIAKRLVKECIAAATGGCSRALSQTVASAPVDRARIRLFMNPKNVWLIKVYEGMGFVTAGKVTLTEGFRANCMDESLPAGTEETEEGRAKWHTRFGMAMEQVVSLA